MNTLAQALEKENIPISEQCINEPGYSTYVLKKNGEDIGFFTCTIRRGLPYVQHFVIYREHRNNKNARKLIKLLIGVLMLKGYIYTIFKIGIGSYLNKFVQYYFKVKPYAEANNRNYYFCSLVRGGK